MNENRKLIEELKKEIGAMETSFKNEKILKEESQKLNKKYEEEINNLESEKDKIKKELDIKILKLNDIEETIQEIINSNNIFNEYNDKIKQISQQKESELSKKVIETKELNDKINSLEKIKEQYEKDKVELAQIKLINSELNNEIDKCKKEKENLIKTFEEEKSVLKNNIQDLDNQLENNNKIYMTKISEANKEIQNLNILFS